MARETGEIAQAASGEHVELWDRPERCELCHDKPPAEDDIFCAECRADVTASFDTITDPVEVALAGHRRIEMLSDLDKQECSCGWRCESGPGLHRRHVAAYIYDALGLEGPQPWEIGSASTMREAMEAAGTVDHSGSQDGAT